MEERATSYKAIRAVSIKVLPAHIPRHDTSLTCVHIHIYMHVCTYTCMYVRMYMSVIEGSLRYCYVCTHTQR